MDGMMYPFSLLLVGMLAYTFNKNHNGKLAILMIGIGIYIVYSHETGYTATDFKNETIQSFDKSADEWSKNHSTDGFDETKAQKDLK